MFITYIVCIRCGMSFYYPSYHRRGPPHPTHTNLPVCLSLIGWQHQSRTTAKIGFLHSHLLQHFSHQSTMVIVHHNLNPTLSPSLQQYYILFKSPSFIYNSYVSLLLRLPSHHHHQLDTEISNAVCDDRLIFNLVLFIYFGHPFLLPPNTTD